MGTVVAVGTDRVLPSFAAFAKHHAVAVDVCPPRRAKRKGVVEKANHVIAARWWRTVEVTTAADAQDSLDAFCERMDDRARHDQHGRPATVAVLAAAESLRAMPASRYPATLEVTRTVTPTALVHYNANRYATDPALVGAQVLVRHHLHTHRLEILHPASGLVTHHRVAAGRGVRVRDGEQAQHGALLPSTGASADGTSVTSSAGGSPDDPPSAGGTGASTGGEGTSVPGGKPGTSCATAGSADTPNAMMSGDVPTVSMQSQQPCERRDDDEPPSYAEQAGEEPTPAPAAMINAHRPSVGSTGARPSAPPRPASVSVPTTAIRAAKPSSTTSPPT